MEVKPGYKQTEGGIIPEEWDVEAVGHAFEIRNHLRLPLSQTVRERMVGSYPYYGPTSVQGWINEYRVEGEHALIGEDGDHFLKWRDQAMTLLVTGKFNVNNHAHIVKGTKNLTAWFYWFFANRDISSYLTRQGAGRYKLTKATLLTLPCAVPPLPEQRAIAEALSDVDGLLGGLDRLIAKKRDLKQAAMQQLLTGQTRLPGFHGEWEVKSLSSICSMKSGEGITSARINQFSKYPCYGGNGLRGFTTKFTHDGGYALVGRQGALCGNVYGVEGQFFASEHAIVATASEDTHIRWLTSVLGRMNLNQYSESSAQPGLSVSKILKLEIAVPPTKAEQTAIAEVLTEMDAELAALEQRREKTRALKQAMMQELLTGRTRLV